MLVGLTSPSRRGEIGLEDAAAAPSNYPAPRGSSAPAAAAAAAAVDVSTSGPMDISMMEEDYDRYDADLQRRGAAALAELQVLRAGVAEQERLSRVVTTERARLAEVRSVRVAPGYSPARYNRVEAAKAKQLDSIRAEISALR